MSTDESWRDLQQPWERLRWARGQTEFSIAADFARAAGIKVAAYQAMEGPEDRSRFKQLDPQSAIKAGRKAKIRWQWILVGDGEPWIVSTDGAADRVREALAGVLDDDAVEELARMAALLERRA